MSKDIKANFVEWNFCRGFQLNPMSAPDNLMSGTDATAIIHIQTY
jgi:hypothetical protein